MRFLRSIFVPEDDACFYLFQATSIEKVREAAHRAALPLVGIAEDVASRPDRSAGRRPNEKGTGDGRD